MLKTEGCINFKRSTRYIYTITNTENGRIYVGITERPKFRFHEHMKVLKRNAHTSVLLQEDYNKYGEQCFRMDVVDETDQLLNDKEREWMIRLKTYDERYGYNCYDIMMNPVRRANGLPYRESKRKGRKFARR